MPTIRPIDIHAHLFSLHYLPVQGILDDSGLMNLSTPAAWLFAKAALFVTRDDPSLDQPRDRPRATKELPSAGDPKVIENALKNFKKYIDTLADQIPDNVLANNKVDEALAYGQEQGFKPLAAKQRRNKRLVLRRLVDIASEQQKYGDKPFKWLLAVVTQRERDIFALLQKTYPEVDLFVNHTMDLDNYYPGPGPGYEFANRQLLRMHNLAQAFSGKLINFVAWDPFRTNGLDIVKEAYQKYNYVGVKFYPPSGYRPTGNEDTDFIPHKNGPEPKKLEERNKKLFRWCLNFDVPIFTHCTPHGLEAFKGSGKNSDPKYWRRLLNSSEFSELKLCLGHAGGAGWFLADERDFEKSFAGGVYKLCSDKKFKNVYCGFGILDQVKTESQFRALQKRLSRLFKKSQIFSERIMYGSDWHMLYLHADHEEFLENYKRLFRTKDLKPYDKKFFRNNAIRYLGLDKSMCV